jgi:hypothetical protein
VEAVLQVVEHLQVEMVEVEEVLQKALHAELTDVVEAAEVEVTTKTELAAVVAVLAL